MRTMQYFTPSPIPNQTARKALVPQVAPPSGQAYFGYAPRSKQGARWGARASPQQERSRRLGSSSYRRSTSDSEGVSGECARPDCARGGEAADKVPLGYAGATFGSRARGGEAADKVPLGQRSKRGPGVPPDAAAAAAASAVRRTAEQNYFKVTAAPAASS